MTLNSINRLFKIATIVTIFGCHAAQGQEISALSAVEQELVKDACKSIDQKLSNKTGSLERIACCYKKNADTDQISASIKTHYVDYRKIEEESKDYTSKLAKSAPEKIEIIYKPTEKNQVTMVQYTKNNRRSSCKYVSIS